MARSDEALAVPEHASQPLKTPDDVLTNPFEQDPELQGLTLYEKKAVLTNRELDRHGMGRYQWSIWILCGFGYLLDLMWAQAFGLVVTPILNEMAPDKHTADGESGNLSSSFGAGLTAGAFVWGVLVDIIGRRWAFNLTCLFSSVFGLCLGAPNTYNGILVLAAFVGFGVGGNIPIDTTICLEFLPQNRRFLLALLSIFQPLGVVICSGIAYGFIPKHSCAAPNLWSCSAVAPGQPCCEKSTNMGWRYTLFTIGGITLIVFLLRFVVFNFRESPKFLLYKGRDAEAIKVLQQIAAFNGTECELTLAHLEALSGEDSSMASDDSRKPVLGAGAKQATASFWTKFKIELSRYKLLFSSPKVTYVTLMVWIAYIFDYWSFSLAGTYLPQILQRKNSSINVSVEETYRDFVIIYLPGIVGVVLGTTMYGVPLIGRKWGMVISSALMGISMFVYSTVNTHASNVGLNLMEYFFQSMYNSILYGWTPEIFPAPIRGTASGLASFWGRIFSIVAPIIGENLFVKSINGVLYLAGAAALVSTLAILAIPTSLIGKQSY